MQPNSPQYLVIQHMQFVQMLVKFTSFIFIYMHECCSYYHLEKEIFTSDIDFVNSRHLMLLMYQHVGVDFSYKK